MKTYFLLLKFARFTVSVRLGKIPYLLAKRLAMTEIDQAACLSGFWGFELFPAKERSL